MKIIKFLFRLVGSNKCAKIIHEKIPLKLSAQDDPDKSGFRRSLQSQLNKYSFCFSAALWLINF